MTVRAAPALIFRIAAIISYDDTSPPGRKHSEMEVSVSRIFKTTSAYKLLILFLASVPSTGVSEDVSSRGRDRGKTVFTTSV